VTLLAGACGSAPSVTEVPSGPAIAAPSGSTTTTPEIPFVPAAWPPAGSACDDPGYTGRLGRIEALDATTVRFSLCAPDGAFRTRLSHPALSIADASWIGRLAVDPGAVRVVPGTGPYRIDAWGSDNVRLARVGPAAGGGLGTVILRWDADPGARMAALLDASVDGIDAPDPSAVTTLDTEPDVTVLGRTALETAYLGFGAGPAFAGVRVRRAIAMGLDRAALAGAGFGAGAVAAAHTAPCDVAGGCEGHAWSAFDAPAAAAAIAATSFNLAIVYPLQVPDAPVPGLPDPAAAAAEVAAQLHDHLGLQVTVTTRPVADFTAALAAGRMDGLYLAGIGSSAADASGFLDPLFAGTADALAASRATGVATILRAVDQTTPAALRTVVLGTANDRIRTTVPIVPLVHPGSAAVFRADVGGAATSPLGLEALGAFTPGDRHQLVFLGESEPSGAWCGVATTLDSFRLCGLVAQGLYGFAAGSLDPEPRLAIGCSPDLTAMTWTCQLRPGVTFTDGMHLDAGDVLASFVALWDARGAIRAGASPGSFAAFDSLFGAPAGG
jgi:ABC-type transport system substrate-binding protein